MDLFWTRKRVANGYTDVASATAVVFAAGVVIDFQIPKTFPFLN